MFSAVVSMRPLPALAPFVGEIRVYEAATGGLHQVELLPNGSMSLMLRTVNGDGAVAVLGPRTRALFKAAPADARCVVVQLTPGTGGQVFGVPASHLADRVVLLEDIWGRNGRRIIERLVTADTEAEALENIQALIAARLDSIAQRGGVRLARQAVDLWRRDHNLRAAAVAARLHVTARHLRRVFLESVGVRPKEFARMMRLQRAMAAIVQSWGGAGVAAEAGYYDQSHMIADFRDLLGMTPTSFAEWRAGSPRGIRVLRARSASDTSLSNMPPSSCSCEAPNSSSARGVA